MGKIDKPETRSNKETLVQTGPSERISTIMRRTLNRVIDTLSGHLEQMKRKLVDKVLRIVNDINDEINLFNGEIETPAVLLRAIERNHEVIKEYTPHLPDKDKEQFCSEQNLMKVPNSNYHSEQTEDDGLRMRGMSDDKCKFNTWQMMDRLGTYIENKHIQSIRIKARCEHLMTEFRTTKRKDLPDLLEKFIEDIRAIHNLNN